jgi:clan AA aspartic protease (TIGR02281 family)
MGLFAIMLGREVDVDPKMVARISDPGAWEATDRRRDYAMSGGGGQQPAYRQAEGYPQVQYAQDSYQPQVYGHAKRAVTRQDCAYGYMDPRTGAFYVDVTLPSTVSGAFGATMQYDPGASSVVLSHADFREMGFDIRRQRFDVAVDTMSAPEPAAAIMLPMIGVGPIRINQVHAIVPERDCGVSLLGQSALRQLGGIEQKGDTLVFQR